MQSSMGRSPGRERARSRRRRRRASRTDERCFEIGKTHHTMPRGVQGVVLAPTRAFIDADVDANARDGVIARAARAAMAMDDDATMMKTTTTTMSSDRERDIRASVARAAPDATDAAHSARHASFEDAREGAIASVRAATGADRALAALATSALDADAEPERRNALARGAMTLRVMGFSDDALVIGALLACDVDVERAAILASM